MAFFTRLTERASAIDSLLCVGLDPHPEMLPEQTPAAAAAFCKHIIAATQHVACAFKPNSAFFELWGPAGMQALQEVLAAIPAEIPVILDAKRGDIASTARAYAQAAFETYGVDAVTINPFLGKDAVDPFITDAEKGVFLLCKTSNPSADMFQTRAKIAGEGLYLVLARESAAWSAADNVGLVVGATDPAALAAVRAVAPQAWFLAPGVGAQGGDLHSALQAGLRADGLGMLVSVSRAIAHAEDPRAAADQLNTDINAVRRDLQRETPLLPAQLALLADALLEAGCVRFGEFTLKSGLQSPIYVDLRRIISDTGLLAQVAAAYIPLLNKLTFDRVAALPYAALPIGTAVALQADLPMIYPRREMKSYGTKAAVEGDFKPGEIALILDDLATTGGSKFEAIETLTQAGLQIRDVVVLIDRQSGASAALAQAGYSMHSVLTLSQLLDYWDANGKVPAEKLQETRAFLAAG